MKEAVRQSGTIPIRPLDRDVGFAGPRRRMTTEVSSADPDAKRDGARWIFTHAASLRVPFLLDLPLTTQGNFTDLAIDLLAPMFGELPNDLYEVDLELRGKVIGTKTFRRTSRHHQFIVSSQLLFEDFNELNLSVRRLSAGSEVPRFLVELFYAQRERLLRNLEHNAIWVFSTARSGSTWLSQDLLCGAEDVRPMDEPGIGRLFAPFDWAAERVYDLAAKATYFESGLEYETRARPRESGTALPPFERAFVYSRQENQIANAQNWRVYLESLKETVFRHVLNEWGVIGYGNVVFKMPNESHAADVIMQAFPDSFMIFLMRDGRDVMKSRFSPFASEALATTTDAELRLYAIAFYSHFWNFQVDIMHSAFTAHPPDRSLFVHYEELRRDTLEQLRVIFDRVGIAIADDELADLVTRTTLENIPADQKGPDKPRQEGQIGKYTDVFSVPEIELMEAIMGPNLRRFGYQLHTGAAG